MATTAVQLPDDPDALKAMVLAGDAENERAAPDHQGAAAAPLRAGAESLPEDQLLLAFEDVEQVDAATAEQVARTDPVKHR